ncbi:MAG: glycosyltransferase family 4 protein [Solirubrobacteraceae bacterium]
MVGVAAHPHPVEQVYAEDKPAGELIAIGHFPPPVHGMAVAVDAFVRLLEEAAELRSVKVTRVDIASEHGHKGVRHHMQRLVRFGRAIHLLLRARGRVCLYASVDAGLGMLYTLGIVVIARLTRTPLYLHHHAADYLNARNVRFRAVCAVGSQVVCHLVGCERMADSLRLSYPSARQVEILPIMYALEGEPAQDLQSRGTRRQAPIVLGHLSNLSLAKGLESVFDTAELMRARGRTCELVVAGPPCTEADRDVLERRLARAGRSARYLGPVFGEERDSFFNAVDVFLFPSRYRHESFGLVAGEALVRGCPVVTFENACLNRDLVSGAGLVLPGEEAFSDRATEWIVSAWADPVQYDRIHEAAADFARKRDAAVEQARHLSRAIVHRTLSARVRRLKLWRARRSRC